MPLVPPSLLAPLPIEFSARPILIAYSGGLDSTVLLDLLAASGASVRAVHVHHGLQAAADDWAAHCEDQCRQRGVSLQLLRVNIDPRDPSGPEAAARKARYEALRSVLQPGELLVTGHHADDQAETFLMRALRGAGVRGLAAMRELQAFDPGWLWRPLLHLHRAELLDYAQARGLCWIEDPQNAEARFERSWLRAEVFPVLRRRRSAAAAALARSAALCAEADELLSELAAEDAKALSRGSQLSVSGLRELSLARRNNLLRWWIGGPRGLPPPPHAVMAEVDGLLAARVDAAPCLAWPGGELRRYRNDLYALPPFASPPAGFESAWDGLGVLRLPSGCGALSGCDEGAPRSLTIRFPQGGERLQPAPGRPSRSLKNLFQEQAVPPWQRRCAPLVYEGCLLRWVGGLRAPESDDAFYLGLRWDRQANT